MIYPSLVIRLNGDRATDKVVVRKVTSRSTLSKRARWSREDPNNGWGLFLVGTFAALQEVGAYVGQGGGWIWRDEAGLVIAVEEVQP